MRILFSLLVLGLIACNTPETKKTAEENKTTVADSLQKAKHEADEMKDAASKTKTSTTPAPAAPAKK